MTEISSDKKQATVAGETRSVNWLLIAIMLAMIGLFVVLIAYVLDNELGDNDSSSVTTEASTQSIYQAEQEGNYTAVADDYRQLSNELTGEDRARYLEASADAYYKAREYEKALKNYQDAGTVYSSLSMDSDYQRAVSRASLCELRIHGDQNEITD